MQNPARKNSCGQTLLSQGRQVKLFEAPTQSPVRYVFEGHTGPAHLSHENPLIIPEHSPMRNIPCGHTALEHGTHVYPFCDPEHVPVR